MSWWVSLLDATAPPRCSYGQTKEEFKPEYEGDEVCSSPCYPPVTVEHHSEGGTYALGGISEAEINVTYNYSGDFHDALGMSFRDLQGKKAKDVIEILQMGAEKLGTKQDADYWARTPGNAGHVLAILATWAEQNPEAIFRVS